MTTTKNNEHKNIKAPNLRFKEFQGEWEKCKLGDKCDLLCGYAFDGKDIVEQGAYLLIRGINITEGIIRHSSELDRYYSGSVDNLAKYKLTTGDLVIGMDGSKVGRNSAIVSSTENGSYLVQRVCRIKSCIGNDFILQLVNNHKFHKYVDMVKTSSAIPHISLKDIQNFPIAVPSIQKEADKISRLFHLLDERIATQNKIIDKLQSLIKGLEDNLLDNPLWEKTYLRSFMQFFSTNSLSWEQLSYEEGEIRNLHYGLIHGFQTRGINSASLPMIKNEAKPKQYTLCQVGDVAFADASEDTGEIAKSVEFVDAIEGDTICGLHTIHGRDIKNRTIVGFKGFVFHSRYFHNQIKRLAQGTKVFSITANNLSSCYVYLPDLETQKAIVELLKAYEAQLIVSRKTLKQYEKQKQYLLRQMFI